MSRSAKKGPYVEEKLLIKVQRAIKANDRKPIKTWSRRSTITPEFVRMTFSVYNGRKFTSIYVTENMVGHKIGEFVPTRTFKRHGAATEVSTELT